MKVRLIFIDRWGLVSEAWIPDSYVPELTDELGRKLVDLSGFGFPRPPEVRKQTDPEWKWITDAFIVRPSPGLSLWWIYSQDDKETWNRYFPVFREAMFLLTGKYLLDASASE